jgi:Na+/H+ antiporter NhaC
MHSVETRAAAGEDPTTEGSSTDEMEQAEAGRHPLILALVPIGIVILATFAGLYISGRVAVGGGAPLFEVLGSADSSAVLLASSFLGMVAAALLAATLGGKPATEVSDSLIGGIKAMMPAMVILLLAWSLGDICGRLGTAEYVIEAVSGRLPAVLVPTTLFVVSALIAFSTGTSWGAMAILIPIAIPLAYQIPLAEGSPEAVAAGVLLGTVGAVLAGATFGDHCSPISDTTILSSMASGCHHIDHVRTQIPYALIAGGVAIVFGYLPSGFGLPPWPGLLLGGVLLALLPRFFKPVETAGPRRKP